jgi:serine/threonine-protein kinase
LSDDATIRGSEVGELGDPETSERSAPTGPTPTTGTGRNTVPPRTVSGEHSLGSRYRDLVELGSGGMGDVYLSVVQGPAGFSKLLVVKRLRASLAQDPELLGMFLTEARIAARLNHPNVVQTIEVGFDGQRHFIAMEYLDGQSLQALVRKAGGVGGIPLAMHIRILAETCAGLHYAHELTDLDGKLLGVVHRDATPHNVFVTYDGQIKIVDFGIAKVEDGERTRTGVLKGKVPYMAPEQIDGDPVDRRTDVYAVGAMLWHAATGQRLWKGLSDIQVMTRVHSGTIPSPREINRLVPERLDAIVRKAMAHKRENRYATCAELQADLEEFLDEQATAPGGARTIARDVGKFTSNLFSEERVQLKSAIDDQLKKLRDSAETPPLPALGIPPGTLSVAAVQTNVSPFIDTNPEGVPIVTLEQARALAGPPEKKSRGWLAVAVALVVLVAAGAMVLSKKPPPPDRSTDAVDHAAPPPQTATSEVQTTSAGPNTPPDQIVTLDIAVEPDSAKVYLDEAKLDVPYHAMVKKDGTSHRLRAEAPGYAPRTEWIAFDRSTIALDWSLDKMTTTSGKVKTIGASTNVPPNASASAAPASSDELQKIPRPKQPKPPLDGDDPWK